MRVADECKSCLMKLAAQTSDLATQDLSLKTLARNRAEEAVRTNLRSGVMSIVVAASIHDAIRECTGNPDPFRSMKDLEINESRTLFELVRDMYTEEITDLLKLAALGNSVDFFRPIEEVKKEIIKNKPVFAIDDSSLLEARVKSSRYVLYLADNAGEVFFDLPLLMLMRRLCRVVYVVKESPVQNDITLDEIQRSGVASQIGEVITTGTATAGIDFSKASHEFKQAFESADFVFAKGMGYYETLEELPAVGKLFFCLKAKCRPVAESLKVPLGSFVARLH